MEATTRRESLVTEAERAVEATTRQESLVTEAERAMEAKAAKVARQLGR